MRERERERESCVYPIRNKTNQGVFCHSVCVCVYKKKKKKMNDTLNAIVKAAEEANVDGLTRESVAFALGFADAKRRQQMSTLKISNSMPTYKSVEQLNKSRMFGKFGGRYIPETLVAAHEELEREYVKLSQDSEFRAEMEQLGRDYVGRPTPMYFCRKLTEKSEAHRYGSNEKISRIRERIKLTTLSGQALMAKRMGKTRVIAETGAGQHGVATATACALSNMPCTVYMGEEDMLRQSLNVFRMRILGTTVKGVTAGSATLKDAINEAMRDWVTNVRTTHYIIGSAIGPHPFPTIVRDFQAVIEKSRGRK